MSNELYCLNPETNRMLKKDTAKYRRMVKRGIIIETTVKLEPVQESEQEQESEPVVEPEPVKPIKKKLAKVAVSLVKKNIDSFRDLNQDETTALLRKLLIEKLAPDTKSKKKKKPEKSKKSKFRIREPSSSEDSD